MTGFREDIVSPTLEGESPARSPGFHKQGSSLKSGCSCSPPRCPRLWRAMARALLLASLGAALLGLGAGCGDGPREFVSESCPLTTNGVARAERCLRSMVMLSPSSAKPKCWGYRSALVPSPGFSLCYAEPGDAGL